MKRPRPEWKQQKPITEGNPPCAVVVVVEYGVLPRCNPWTLAPLFPFRFSRPECHDHPVTIAVPSIAIGIATGIGIGVERTHCCGILATSSTDSSSSSSGAMNSKSTSNTTANSNANANANTTAPSGSGDALRNAVAGAMAGIFSRTMTAPIERVKLVLQLQRAPSALNAPSLTTVPQPNPNANPNATMNATMNANVDANIARNPKSPAHAPHWNAWTVCHKIYTTEGGLWAFWRGNTPNVLRQSGASALNFMLMDWYKAAMAPLLAATLALSESRSESRSSTGSGASSTRSPERRALDHDRSIASSFLSGGLAGGTTTTVLYPVEFLRTRLALDVGSPRSYPGGMRDVLRQIWTTDGVRGLYQGYGIALAGVVVYRALHLGGYDACKTEVLHRRRGSSSGGGSSNSNNTNGTDATITMGERFAIAQVVSTVAGTICYPIDSVRRRLMMQAGQPPTARTYTNARDAFGTIWRTEGARGFYLGLGPNIVRSIAGALLLVSYDVFRGRIGSTTGAA